MFPLPQSGRVKDPFAKAVAVKGMLAWEDEELSTQYWQAADPALFTRLDDCVAHVKCLNLGLDLLGRVR